MACTSFGMTLCLRASTFPNVVPGIGIRGKELIEPLGELLSLRFGSWLTKQIETLHRVALQIIKFKWAIGKTCHILPLVEVDRPRRLHFVKHHVFPRQRFAA